MQNNWYKSNVLNVSRLWQSIILLFLCFGAFAQNNIIDGITLVAPPKEYLSDPLVDILKVGAGWISCVPYGYFKIGKPGIRFNIDRQWWGERKEGIVKTLEYAHSNGVKVMLKPQLWSHTGWIGSQKFTEESDWLAWEESYQEYILFYTKIAVEHDVEMICIGTELKEHALLRPMFFRKLIDKIKETYCGQLIYSANWDSYDQITFWDQLDYIGLSAYFPLSEKKEPSIDELLKEWEPVCIKLKNTSLSIGKKILFTEFGYLSVDGAGGKTWLLEKEVRSLSVNEQTQANCFDALFLTFSQKDYWAGGFLWKWFPHGKGGEGYNERDYTPQGKKAEKTITKWYSILNP